MSELVLSFLIAVGILAAMFIFVPMLHVCNDRCQRLFLRRRSASQPASPEQANTNLRDAA